MKKPSRKQAVLVIVSASILISLSVVMTLYVTGVLWRSGSAAGDSGHRNVTFTDAVLTCKKSTRSTYGQQIHTLVTDDHSSRFDERQFVYKIFLKMDLLDAKSRLTVPYHINCFVRTSTGGIDKYEVIAEGSEASRQADETNVFGMPKRNKKGSPE